MREDSSSPLAQYLDTLVREAVTRDVPPAIVREACDATMRAMRAPAGPLTPQTRRRAEAYFGAVVRRRVVRRRQSPRAAARFVVAAVVEDLRSTGRSGADIWDELERGWAQRVPSDVLEEYRLRLCG